VLWSGLPTPTSRSPEAEGHCVLAFLLHLAHVALQILEDRVNSMKDRAVIQVGVLRTCVSTYRNAAGIRRKRPDATLCDGVLVTCSCLIDVCTLSFGIFRNTPSRNLRNLLTRSRLDLRLSVISVDVPCPRRYGMRTFPAKSTGASRRHAWENQKSCDSLHMSMIGSARRKVCSWTWVRWGTNSHVLVGAWILRARLWRHTFVDLEGAVGVVQVSLTLDMDGPHPQLEYHVTTVRKHDGRLKTVP
jgi:hypothetical protein